MDDTGPDTDPAPTTDAAADAATGPDTAPDAAVAALEALMRRAPTGAVDAEEFYTALADAELLVLLTPGSTPDDLNLPVLDRDGTGVVPVFTSEARLEEFGATDHNHLLIHGRDLRDVWPEGLAAALNPGTEGQAMDIPGPIIMELARHSAYEPPEPPLDGGGEGAGPLGLGGLTVTPDDEVTAVVERTVASLDAVARVRLYTVQDLGGEPETAVVLQLAPGRSVEADLDDAMAAVLAAVRKVRPAAALMDEGDVEEARALIPEFAPSPW